ncbi:MAG: hypothetical protein U1F11_14765 [Steroidobacteraceae bacterium]
MQAAIERLEARLAKEPGDAAGWQLLAQSYEFMGRAEDAARARDRAAGGTGTAMASAPAAGAAATRALAAPPTAGPAAAAVPQGAAPTAALAGGKDVNALVLAAQTARRQRDFKASIAAFEQLARRGAMTADLWADYADAVGADRRTLDDASEPLIRKALALDPNHAKALWLLGSLQVQRGDYRGALATWERMQKVLQPGSSDARLIAENIAEARAALGGPGPGAATLRATAAALPAGTGASAAPPAAAAAGVALRGEVQLDARFRNKVAAGTVLFVFAKAVGQPGPPVAVLRTTAARWPVAFVLDDSLAMMPGRNLSNSRSVVVEARLSRSGSANPSPGDLRGTSAALDPHGSAPLRIVIDEQIG